MIKYFCDRCEQEAKDISKECLTSNDCVISQASKKCKKNWSKHNCGAINDST
jgi:hypothetical protein